MSVIGSIPGFGGSFFQNAQRNGGPEAAAQEALKKLQAQGAALTGEDRSSASGIGRSLSPQQAQGAQQYLPLEGMTSGAMAGSGAGAPSFANMLRGLVDGVDKKETIAAGEAQSVMLGKSDNIHQAMIAMQEAGVAFNLMLEVRNKLVESYKELTRMQV